MKQPESSKPSPPVAGSVRVGDRYHRSDKRATVEVVRVTETHVECEVSNDGDSWRFTETREKFRELEAKSLELGAVFEPAQNDQAQARPEEKGN